MNAYEARVLKVALDEDKAAALRAEARVLDVVGGGVIVRKLDGPRLLGGRTVLDLQYGGGEDLDGGTLGALLRAEGRLTYHQLERFGNDLFHALDQLAARGVRHRDLKPDNFAVFERADRSKQLMLLDFSLAEASERDVAAGTRGYLDPFLGTARRPVFDDHAERYAAAVTLHEMASGARPVWGDGITDPRTTTDEAPTISAELFEPALRDELVAFFRRALHRDVDRRFDAVAPDARGVARRVPRVRRGGTGDHAGHRRARPAFAGGVPGGRRPGRPARHPAGRGRALAPGGVGGPVVRRVHRRRAAGRAAAPDRPRARRGGGDPQGDQPAAQAVGRAARGRGAGRAGRRPVRGRRAGVVADAGDRAAGARRRPTWPG